MISAPSDLNDYYCSSNLPRLYRARGKSRTTTAAPNRRSIRWMIACERAKQRGQSDDWLNATLLTAAFDAGDADKAEELADEIDAAGTAPYKIEITKRRYGTRIVPRQAGVCFGDEKGESRSECPIVRHPRGPALQQRDCP
jgi:hypothetical protein